MNGLHKSIIIWIDKPKKLHIITSSTFSSKICPLCLVVRPNLIPQALLNLGFKMDLIHLHMGENDVIRRFKSLDPKWIVKLWFKHDPQTLARYCKLGPFTWIVPN